jgi:pyridoxine/pyridoxamine 5'-phosphate oxidase
MRRRVVIELEYPEHWDGYLLNSHVLSQIRFWTEQTVWRHQRYVRVVGITDEPVESEPVLEPAP